MSGFDEYPNDQWIPHKRETWPWRIGILKNDVEFRHWHGHGADPEFTYEIVSAGTKVKIVMVSRFGDVGITKNLDAEMGYAARVSLDVLEKAE